MDKQTVWVATGTTESGDDWGPYVFDYEPTLEEVTAVLKEDMPYEFEDEEYPTANPRRALPTTIITRSPG